MTITLTMRLRLDTWTSTGAGFGHRSRRRWPPRTPRGRSTTRDSRTARRRRAPGNVRIQRATCGTRLVRHQYQHDGGAGRRARFPGPRPAHARRGESEQHVAGQRRDRPPPRAAPVRAGPPRASPAHRRRAAPAALRRGSVVRRTGPVGVTSTTRLAGSSRVNAAAAASSAKQIGSSTVAAAGNAAPQPPTTTATPLTTDDRRPRPGPQYRPGHHAVTAWVNPPVPASTSRIAAATPAMPEGTDDAAAQPAPRPRAGAPPGPRSRTGRAASRGRTTATRARS